MSCAVVSCHLFAHFFMPYLFLFFRLMTSSMLLLGVALNKAALLTLFVSIVVSMVLFAWSIASFVDGVGITGILAVLIPFFVWAECCRVSRSKAFLHYTIQNAL